MQLLQIANLQSLRQYPTKKTDAKMHLSFCDRLMLISSLQQQQLIFIYNLLNTEIMKQIILSIVTASTLLFTACTPTNITPTTGALTGGTTSAAVSAATTITIKGKHIVTTCGDTIILKGVNYAPYGWGWNNSENLFPEIAKSGANSVRLVWYKTNSGPAYSNLALLDSAIARCIRYKMIPILELHDET
jgi:hypothetical protein